MKQFLYRTIDALKLTVICAAFLGFTAGAVAQTAPAAAKRALQAKNSAPVQRPKLVVMLVVDQMRADYVDKFRGQWSGGLKRLLDEGAWFREAAYPYAGTETCVGHSTISTGSFPASHGMVANSWWDREHQKMVTCTNDPSAKNIAYAGGSAKSGDSAVRMQMPAYAEELKIQTGGGTRVVTFSLKARAAITMAGHKADAVTWFDDSGALVTSSVYGAMPFVEDFAKKNPVAADYGKTWSLSLPKDAYWYEEKTRGAAKVVGWTDTFPYPLRGSEKSTGPDGAFYGQWATSPLADTYLTKLAENAVDSLGLGKGGGTDYLGVSYSSVDYVGHTFGPRSWEIQDILIRLDKDLAQLFAHLDAKVGKGNYVVALSADHGVAPIPGDMAKIGVDADVLNLPTVKDRIEKVLEPLNYAKPAVAKIAGNEIYFAEGIYNKLKSDPSAMHAVLDACTSMPGVAAVYTAEELSGGAKSISQTRVAAEWGFYPGRSGDLYILQKPYWLTESNTEGERPHTGTGHGTPYYYDQRVPIFFMGYGILPGEYFEEVTPADIAPTLGALTGVTLASHDGHVLGEALKKRVAK